MLSSAARHEAVSCSKEFPATPRTCESVTADTLLMNVTPIHLREKWGLLKRKSGPGLQLE